MKKTLLKILSFLALASVFLIPALYVQAAYSTNRFIAGSGMVIDTTDPNAPIFNAISSQSGKQLISGGVVWSGTGLTYNVSALTYYFNGNHTSAATSVTLDPSDPTDNRTDAIVVDELGNVTKITGMAAPNPPDPVIPDDQLVVAYITVEAGSTAPTVLSDSIYQENTEWATSNYGSGPGTTNFAATNSCQSGSVCIDNFRDRNVGDLFTRASDINASLYTTLQIYERITSPLASNNSTIIRFYNSSGVQVGNAINLDAYGFNKNLVNTWQLVVVPIANFGSITNIRKMSALMQGTNGVPVEWDLDNIVLSNGTSPVINTTGLKFQKDGTSVATQGIVNFLSGAGNTVSVLNDAANNRVNVKIEGVISNGTGLQSASLFGGVGAGTGAIAANEAIFYGTDAGNGAISADHSVFIGYQAGKDAVNANNSVFIGQAAGLGSQTSQAIAFGYRAGFNDTATGPTILIGSNTNANAFNNGVVIGIGGQATADNQFLVSSSSPFTNITLDSVGFVKTNGAIASPTMQVFSSTGNVTISNSKRGLYYDPASTQATATITLPSTPTDGQEIIISFGGTVTTGTVVTLLTVAPNSGQAIVGTLPTTATVDSIIEYKWRASVSKWYEID